MELSFLGRGAAFNPKEGNNSAYFIENNQLFLICYLYQLTHWDVF